jgi:hypothetical protein
VCRRKHFIFLDVSGQLRDEIPGFLDLLQRSLVSCKIEYFPVLEQQDKIRRIVYVEEGVRLHRTEASGVQLTVI